MATTKGTSPKGLFNALALFISVGLFSLATLFTLLILDIRSSQQQLAQQISGAPFSTFPPKISSQQGSEFSPDHRTPLSRQLSLLQTTLESRSPLAQLDALSDQLNLLDQKIEKLSSAPPANPALIATVDGLGNRLENLSTALSAQGQQTSLQQDQLTALMDNHKQLQKHLQQQSQQIGEQLTALSTQLEGHQRSPSPPIERTVSPLSAAQLQAIKSGLKQLSAEIEQRDANQKQIILLLQQLTSVQPDAASTSAPVAAVMIEPLRAIQQQLDQLTSAQPIPPPEWKAVREQLSQMSHSIKALENRKSPAPTPTADTTEQLEAIQQQLEKLSNAQPAPPPGWSAVREQLTELSHSIKKPENRKSPAPPSAAATAEQLEAIQQQLDRLSSAQPTLPPGWRAMRKQLDRISQSITTLEQGNNAAPPSAALTAEQLKSIQQQLNQQQIKRSPMKSQVQSNRIKPYSYQAR